MTTSAQKDIIDPYGWDSELLDLEAYLKRIGYEGSLEPTIETLRALSVAHILTFPFENLDILVSREIKLDVKSLVGKMVTRGRGGYCYEQNMLFGAVLEKLGFQVSALGARLINSTDETLLRSGSHAALLITIENRHYLMDAGFGSNLEPIELVDGNEFETNGGWKFKVNHIDHDMWVLRKWQEGEWLNIHKSSLTPFYRADYIDANYIAQHHPRSPFHKTITLSVSKLDHDVSLTGLTLERNYADGRKTEETVEAKDIPELAENEFDITLSEEEKAAVVAIAKPLSMEELMGD